MQMFKIKGALKLFDTVQIVCPYTQDEKVRVHFLRTNFCVHPSKSSSLDRSGHQHRLPQSPPLNISACSSTGTLRDHGRYLISHHAISLFSFTLADAPVRVHESQDGGRVERGRV